MRHTSSLATSCWEEKHKIVHITQWKNRQMDVEIVCGRKHSHLKSLSWKLQMWMNSVEHFWIAKRSDNGSRPWHLFQCMCGKCKAGWEGPSYRHNADISTQRHRGGGRISQLWKIWWNVSHICRINFISSLGETKPARDICQGEAPLN